MRFGRRATSRSIAKQRNSPDIRSGQVVAGSNSVSPTWRSKSWSTSFPDVISQLLVQSRGGSPPSSRLRPSRHKSSCPPGAGRSGFRPCALVSDGDPLAGAPFYVNPNSAAVRAAQSADPPSPQLTAIANTPQAYWIVPGSSAATVGKYTGDAAAAGAIPVLALYGIPHRDCGSLRSGWHGYGDDYRAWIDGIAAGVGASRAAIVVEPDALAMADCLSGDQRQERYDLIRYAVDTLTRDPNAAVYVDARSLALA